MPLPSYLQPNQGGPIGPGTPSAPSPQHYAGYQGPTGPQYGQPGWTMPGYQPQLLPHRTRRNKVVAGAVGASVLLAGSVVAVTMLTGGHDGKPAAAASYLTAAPAASVKGACLDKSGSVDQDQHLATAATTALQASVGALTAYSADVPDWQATTSARGLDLLVRVVRKNSYDTSDGGAYTVHPTPIPSSPGLKSGQPSAADSDSNDIVQWQSDFSSLTAQRKVQTARHTAMVKSLGALTKLTSDGSDISGCMSALLQILGPEPGPHSYLVVTDCADTLLKNPDGSPRQLAGNFGEAMLTVVQACPSGNPAQCQALLDAFLKRMERLGLKPGNVRVYRPEEVSAAITTWLRA